MTETEIKLTWNGTAAEARARIEREGFPAITARTLESDQLFDRASGELRESGQLLRLRRAGSGDRTEATVTYKGPAMRGIYKSREEIEFVVSDPDAFALVLSRLQYQPGFRYQKLRTQFRAPGDPGLIALDETPIGIFLELEGPEYWIDATAARLDFSPADYMTDSYAVLYRQYCTRNLDAPPDMTFGADPH